MFVATVYITEVAQALEDGAKNLRAAVCAALTQARGAYALGIVSADEPNVLYAARHGSPLVLGYGQDEFFVASDASAIVTHTRHVTYMDDGEMAIITPSGIEIRWIPMPAKLSVESGPPFERAMYMFIRT